MCPGGEGGIKLLSGIGLMHQTPFRRLPSSCETAPGPGGASQSVSRRRTASALRREAPHYAGFEPAVGSGTGFAGRPKVTQQETQLFGSPPQRDLRFCLSSLCHNLQLIQSEPPASPVTRLTFAAGTSAVQNPAAVM